MREPLAAAPIGVVEVSPAGTVRELNDAACELLDVDRDAAVDADLRDAFPRSAAGTLRDTFDGTTPEPGSFEEYYPGIDRWLAVEIAVADERTFVYVRSRDEVHDQRQRLERLERRLDRLGTIDRTVDSVLQAVIDASDRDEVLDTLTTRLGNVDPYAFVWVGEREPGSESLALACASGPQSVYEAVEDALAADGTTPAGAALAEATTVTNEPLPADETVPRPLRVAAFSEGLQSAAAVPLSYRDTIHGVLAVHSTNRDGFSEAELTSLRTLCAVAGFAITASRRETLLFGDRVTELTVTVRDDGLPFVAAARAADAELTLRSAIPGADTAAVCYLHGPTGEAPAVDVLDSHESVGTPRRIRSDDGGFLIEVAATADTVVGTLANRGVTVEEAEYTGEDARVVAAVPPDVDLRRQVETLNERFERVEVVTKRRRPSGATSDAAFRATLDESLTDRQRTVLRAAHAGDYFTSPKGSSSEEIAEALDITGPTVLYHLRNAQRKLLNAYFDADVSTGEPQ